MNDTDIKSYIENKFNCKISGKQFFKFYLSVDKNKIIKAVDYCSYDLKDKMYIKEFPNSYLRSAYVLKAISNAIDEIKVKEQAEIQNEKEIKNVMRTLDFNKYDTVNKTKKADNYISELVNNLDKKSKGQDGKYK